MFDEDINSGILLKEEREAGAQKILKRTVLLSHAKGISVEAIATLFDLNQDTTKTIISDYVSPKV